MTHMKFPYKNLLPAVVSLLMAAPVFAQASITATNGGATTTKGAAMAGNGEAMAATATNGGPAPVSGPVRAIGRVTGVKIDGPRVLITTENAHAEITVYGPGIIRVRVTATTAGPDISYAVVGTPVKTAVTIGQDPSAIRIATDSLRVVIQKNPFAVTFLTL